MSTHNPWPEFDAVRSVVHDYMDGMFYADEAKLRSAFHPKSFVIGHFGGTLEYDTLDSFVAFVKGEPKLPPGTSYVSDIASIDITGDIAAAKVIVVYSGHRYTDYLTLLKHDGRWQIVNKAYCVRERA